MQRRRKAIASTGLRGRLLVCIGVPVVVFCGVTPAAAASTPRATPSSSGPEYGVRPALTGQTSLTHNHFAYALGAGGTSIADAVVVSNYTNAPLSFVVHGADMLDATGGGMAPAPEGAAPQAVGGWISVQQPQITVPPHKEVQDAFTVTVPKGQAAGELFGALVVAETASGAGIHVLTRAALTVDVTVVERAVLKLATGPLSAAQQQDGMHLSVVVHNTGNVLFTFTGSVEVRDGSGGLLATVPLDPTGLYVIPGGDATVSGVWSGVPLWGSADATATVVARTTGGASATGRSDTVHLGFFAWGLVLGPLAALLAALLAVPLVRRRLRAAAPAAA